MRKENEAIVWEEQKLPKGDKETPLRGFGLKFTDGQESLIFQGEGCNDGYAINTIIIEDPKEVSIIRVKEFMSEDEDGEQEWFITGIQLFDKEERAIVDIELIESLGEWQE